MAHRHDDNESALFFARDLEFQEATVYETEYPEISFRRIFPVNNQGGRGIREISYKMLDKAGVAQIIADGADDAPRINLSASEHKAKVFMVGDAWGYTTQELDAAIASNTRLDSMGLTAMREAYERKLDEIASDGKPSLGLLGLNSNPNIPIIAPTTSSGGGDDTWVNKTAEEILADMTTLYRTVLLNTANIHRPTAFLISPDRALLLRTARLSGTTGFLGDTVRGLYPGVELIEWDKMATAGVGGTQRMTALVRRPDVLEFREPDPFRIQPLRRDSDYRWSYVGDGLTAGVVVRKPLAICHMDGI